MTRRQRRGRMQRRRRAAVAARSVAAAGGLAVAATLLSGAVAEAETLTVTNLNAQGPGSLYAEIAASNSYTGSASNTIVFASGLSGTIDAGFSPDITHPVSIVGPGANLVTVESGFGIYLYSGSSVTDEISGLTLTANPGRVIDASSPVELSGDVIEGAAAGIYATGALTVVGSTIIHNGPTGGGISAKGTTVIEDSTIAYNTSILGGGIQQYAGSLSVIDSTIVGNNATAYHGFAGFGYGGGIALGYVGSVSLDSSIISGNTAANGGPDVATMGGSPPTLVFSLLGSTSGSNITPTSTDLVGVNPLLGPLQNNGGPTPTVAPAFNSPVIDQGDSEGLTTDQRGLPRPVDFPGYPNAPGGDGSDIGAVELQASEVAPVVSRISPSTGSSGTSVTISGSRLSTATKVLFGSTPAQFTVNGSGQVVASAPSAFGTVDVRVVTPGGESATVTADQFTYPTEPTSTVLSSSNVNAQYGTPVTLTAAVSPAPSNGGTVEFEDSDTGQAIAGCGSQPVNTSSGKATCTTSTLPLGSEHIVAVYSGANGFKPSTSGPITQVIVPDVTSTSISSSNLNAQYGAPVTLTAAVSPAPSDGGTVEFEDTDTGQAIAGCGSRPVDASSGKATCTTSSLPVGSESIKAVYSGTSEFDPSSSGAITEAITPAQTSLSAAHAKQGLLSITLSATLTRTDNSAAIAGETIVFSLPDKQTCHATTSSLGVASCKVVGIALPIGAYTASFAGDADYQASTAAGKL